MPDNDVTWTAVGKPLAMVQVSWIIHNAQRELVEKRDFYIANTDFELSVEAVKLHGIDSDKLKRLGVDREVALRTLKNDMQRYEALIVGHFIQFDLQLLQREFERIGMDNPFIGLPTCCTMQASAMVGDHPFRKFYKLEELYAFFFGHTDRNWHNAAEDAEATAKCFYRLYDQGLIRTTKLAASKPTKWFTWLLWLSIVAMAVFIVYVSLY